MSPEFHRYRSWVQRELPEMLERHRDEMRELRLRQLEELRQAWQAGRLARLAHRRSSPRSSRRSVQVDPVAIVSRHPLTAAWIGGAQ